MSKPKFVYVIYIQSTVEKVWDAFTKPEFTRQYWCGTWHDTTWKAGASWKLMIPDGRVGDVGEVVEAEKPKRIVLRWRNEFRPELKKEGYSICTIEMEQAGAAVKLKLTHEMDGPESKLIEAMSQGWPMILSSMKTMLETGESIEDTREWPKGF